MNDDFHAQKTLPLRHLEHMLEEESTNSIALKIIVNKQKIKLGLLTMVEEGVKTDDSLIDLTNIDTILLNLLRGDIDILDHSVIPPSVGMRGANNSGQKGTVCSFCASNRLHSLQPPRILRKQVRKPRKKIYLYAFL